MSGDIDTMEAGRELDHAVAREVFGLNPDARVIDRVYQYSTSIADAWKVVEKMCMSVVQSEDGFYAIIPEDIDHGPTNHPKLTLIGKEGEQWPVADTAPRAICIAALRDVRAAKAVTR